MSLPTALYRAEQVRELDRLAIAELKIDGYHLMQRAGRSAWDILMANWPAARTVCVVCGGGNNGGDGYVLAGLASKSGRHVLVISLVPPDLLKGDARKAYQFCRDCIGADIQTFSPTPLAEADVIIDAILGTGLDREVSGFFLEAITTINDSGKPVLALDIPSGLHADSGKILGAAVHAAITVTFVGMKQGLYSGAGREYCGRIYFSSLDMPAEFQDRLRPAAIRMDLSTQSHSLNVRARDGHKGHYGHVLVLGGDYGYAGAARMASQAAARTGAGLVTLGTRPEHAVAIPLVVPEIMAHSIKNITDLHPLLKQATVVAIGPGLGQSSWGSSLLTAVLETDLPLVIDADALNMLARDPVASERWVLTPHPGEAARMLQTTTEAVADDRFASIQRLQEMYGGVCVLKGSGTLVANGDAIYLCSGGNPGMASGGMGDVLTGIIAGLIAQNLGLAEAARLGVCLHAAAADAAAGAGERGMLATDLMPWVRKLSN